MKKLRFLTITAFLITVITFGASAQLSFSLDKMFISANVGVSTMYADISEKGYSFMNNGSAPAGFNVNGISASNSPFSSQNMQNRRLMSDLRIGFQPHSYWGFYFNFIQGSLYDERADFDISVETEIYETSLILYVNVNDLLYGADDRRRAHISLYSGFGLVHFISNATLLSTGEYYAHKGSDKWGRTQEGVIPIGIDFKYHITQDISFNMNTSLRGMNTDQLDAFESDLTSVEGYGYTSVGITYNFGTDSKSRAAFKRRRSGSSVFKTRTANNRNPVNRVRKGRLFSSSGIFGRR